jgi:hypothetical protein
LLALRSPLQRLQPALCRGDVSDRYIAKICGVPLVRKFARLVRSDAVAAASPGKADPTSGIQS